MNDADISAVIDRLADAARAHQGAPHLRARLADVVHAPLKELQRLKRPQSGRPLSAIGETSRRLAARPQGVANGELVEAADVTPEKAGSHLADAVRQGRMFKVVVAPRRNRYFLTAGLAAAFKARLDEASR